MNKGLRVDIQIDCIDEQIVHVEQNAAASARHQLGEKFLFAHLAAAERQIVGKILDQNFASQNILYLLYTGGDMCSAHPVCKGKAADR